MESKLRIISTLDPIHNLKEYWNVIETDSPRHYLGISFLLHRPSDNNYNIVADKNERDTLNISIFGRNLTNLEDFLSRLLINTNEALLTSLLIPPKTLVYSSLIRTITEDLDLFTQPSYQNILIQLPGQMWKDIAISMGYKYNNSPTYDKFLWDNLAISVISRNILEIGLFIRSNELNKYKRQDYAKLSMKIPPYNFLPLYQKGEEPNKFVLKEHHLLTYGHIRVLLEKETTSLIDHPLFHTSKERIMALLKITLQKVKNRIIRAIINHSKNRPYNLKDYFRALQLNYLYQEKFGGLLRILKLPNILPVLPPIKLKKIKYSLNFSSKDFFNLLKEASRKYSQSPIKTNEYITSILPNIANELDRYRVWNIHDKPLYRDLILRDFTEEDINHLLLDQDI